MPDPLRLLAEVTRARLAAEPDADLLRRFAGEEDHEAFAELVRRYAGLVWRVCRLTAGPGPGAEDAFQATFLALVRRAGSVRRADSLAGWLHRTARRAAVRANRTDRPPPAPPAKPPAPGPLDQLTGRELLAAVDEEIGRLPERFRVPLLLCAVEGVSQEDAAARLGWSAGSVRGRLERARSTLRKRLVARGLTFPVGLIGLAVAPSELVAVTLAGVRNGGWTPAVSKLGLEAARMAIPFWWKSVAAAGACAAGLGYAVVAGSGGEPSAAGPAPAPAVAPGPEEPAVDAKAKPESTKPVSVAGVCQDEAGRPVAGARVTLYQQTDPGKDAEQVRDQETGADGRFSFPGVPAPPKDGATRWGVGLTATRPGRGSAVQELHPDMLKTPLHLRLGPAATLQGRVTDPAGNPVAGARVWDNAATFFAADRTVRWARTDADGRYAIADMTAWGPDATKPRPSGDGKTMMAISGCYFSILHPDFGQAEAVYRTMPATVDVVLQPAGVVEGRVVDRVSGKPAAGVTVSAQATSANGNGVYRETRTGPDGKYRIPSLLAGAYNVWAAAPDRACAALDSFAVTSGRTGIAPDLQLVEGGWLEGRVVAADTGKPIPGTQTGGDLSVGLYGPSRPRSGAACQSSPVDAQGRFRMRVAPGVNFPYIMRTEVWERTQRQEFFKKGIEVKDGEVVAVEFRVLPTKPIADPDPDPVRLAVPVAAEREAAALVRNLGGWYEVDGDGHVVGVNMVYHHTPEKRRYQNTRTDTDAALRAAGAFPHLKTLLLHKGQATDDGLKAVTGLRKLEVLMVWDAVSVSDVGVSHLEGLSSLRRAHFSSGKLGDGALATFSRLPDLRELSLQGNAITDDGLKHLAGMTQLRHLWVGMSTRPITDAGVRHLAGLTAMESLDLQSARVSDAGVAALKGLKELRSLHLNSAEGTDAISDASVEHLLRMTKLQTLWVTDSRLTEDGARRLLGMAGLKKAYLKSSAIPPERWEQLRKLRPDVTPY